MATDLYQSVRSIRSTNPGYYTYDCEVIENSYSIENNTSNVTINFWIKGPWTPSFYQWTTYCGIYVDGSCVTYANPPITPYVSSSWLKLISWTGNIAHNTDGSKSIKVGAYLNNGSAGYLPTQYYSSAPLTMGTATLTTIPRASTITSAGNVTLGNACSIKWTPLSSNFKYKIKFSLGGWSYTTGFISPNTTSAYTYTGYTIPTTTIYAQLPSSTSGTMTATLTTYNSSGTQIGSASSKTFTVYIPSTVVPTVGTITLTPKTYSYLIQGKNKLTVSVDGCSAGTGSSIKSYTFSGPGISSTTTATSVTSSTISNTGTLTYTVTVTDNRGRTASESATITCYTYSAPYFTSFSAYRSNKDGTADNSGTYIKCLYTVVYSYVNGTNARKSFSISGGTSSITYSSWTTSQTTGYNGVVTATSSALIDLNGNTTSTYKMYATITDNYSGSSTSQTITVFGASRILNITKDGTGVAFGKMAESTKLLESRYKIKAPGLTSSRGTRPTNPDIALENDYLGCVEHYLVTNSMTSNRPALGDGHILHLHWDNAYQLDSQLYLHHTDGAIMSRGCNNGTWGSWNAVQYKPTQLYGNINGTSGTIQWSNAKASDFTFMEIYYMDNNSQGRKSIGVYLNKTTGKTVEISCIEPSTTTNTVYIRNTWWVINDNSLVCSKVKWVSLTASGSSTTDNSNTNPNPYIKITGIFGYK